MNGKWLISHSAVYDNWGQEILTNLKPYRNISILLSANIDINFFDTVMNNNALTQAVFMKNVSMVQFLIQKGASPYQKLNNGLTILSNLNATLKNTTHPEAIKILQQMKQLFESVPIADKCFASSNLAIR